MWTFKDYFSVYRYIGELLDIASGGYRIHSHAHRDNARIQLLNIHGRGSWKSKDPRRRAGNSIPSRIGLALSRRTLRADVADDVLKRNQRVGFLKINDDGEIV